MEYWYGIPRGVELTPEQIGYFARLAMMYIDERLPELTEAGERIPRKPRGSRPEIAELWGV